MWKSRPKHNKQKELEQDLRLYAETFREAYVKEAATLLTQTATIAIQRFYDDYTPRYYKRTNNLLRHSYSKYYHNNGKRLYGGVRISAKDMLPYDVSGGKGTPSPLTEKVVMWSWKYGYHGYYNHDPNQAILTVAPALIVENTLTKTWFLRNLNHAASLAVRKNTYQVLKIRR